jgi:hypothetical protein
MTFNYYRARMERGKQYVSSPMRERLAKAEHALECEYPPKHSVDVANAETSRERKRTEERLRALGHQHLQHPCGRFRAADEPALRGGDRCRRTEKS